MSIYGTLKIILFINTFLSWGNNRSEPSWTGATWSEPSWTRPQSWISWIWFRHL